MKNAALILFCLGVAFPVATAQQLPEMPIQIQSDNYYEICQQLDAYFAEEYDEAADTDCWDNERVKYERWRWLWRDRVLPNGNFPDMGAQWLDFQKAKASAQAESAAQPLWRHEGPTKNTGGGYWGMGRTKHVAFHPTNPNLFYVGTPDGGIWRTTDSGITWEALGDDLPYLPVSNIRIDHQNPDIIYINLGGKDGWWEYGLGIYKSTDAGQTWAPTGLSFTLPQRRVLYEFHIHPDDPQVLLAAANNGIWRTTDAGQNWTKVYDGEIIDLKQRPGDPTTWYAVRHDYWGNDNIIKSTNGGLQWGTITQFTETQNDIEIAVTPANPDFVGLRMSAGKKFYLSKNSGDSFTFMSEMPEDWHIQFSPTDSNVVYAGGVSTYQSTDQGLTWEQYTNWYDNGIHPEVHADVHDMVHNPHNPEEIFFCNDGGIYRHNEAAGVWEDLSNGLGIAQFYRIAVSEAGQFRLAAGSQDNGGWLRKSATTTANWVHTNGGDAMTQAIDPNNSSILFTEYYGGNAIYRSMNSWGTHIELNGNLPPGTNGDWVTPFIMNPLRPQSMLFGFDEVFVTHDRGDHFTRISDSLTGNIDRKIRDIRYSPADTNTIVASWANKLYYTKNGGQNWIARNLPGNEDITRIAMHPTDSLRFWVSRSGYAGLQKVYETKNGGLTWKNSSFNLPNVPVNCVLYDSLTNYLLVGTDIGVFYSDADLINWKPYGDGLPNVWVLDLQLRQTDRRLYVGTHGRGVYSVLLETVVSSHEPTIATAVGIYPNPTAQWVFFKDEKPFSGQIRVVDTHGKLFFEQKINNAPLSNTQIHVANWPMGLYCLSVLGENGTVGYQKIVVANK